MPRTDEHESWINLEKDNAYMAKMKAELEEPNEVDKNDRMGSILDNVGNNNFD